MWNPTEGRTFFHALKRYKLLQTELRGMASEQFDSLRVFVAKLDERTPRDSGTTVGQLMNEHRDDEEFAVVYPGTQRRHDVLDVDKDLENHRIVFSVAINPLPE